MLPILSAGRRSNYVNMVICQNKLNIGLHSYYLAKLFLSLTPYFFP